MKQIGMKGLLLNIFIPTTLLTLSYLLLGHFCKIPHLLLFCLLGTVFILILQLSLIFRASKKAFGAYSLKSAFVGQEKFPFWKSLIIAFVFFGVAGLLSAFVAPLENQLFAPLRSRLLSVLPAGFDWTNFEYIKSFPKPVLVITCVYYCIFNVFLGPVTEELFFRGYLTSHYKTQNSFTPILIAILFSLYHFWLPFNNIFRILAFGSVAYVAYKKKNIYISIFFHCICNLLTSVSFVLEVLG